MSSLAEAASRPDSREPGDAAPEGWFRTTVGDVLELKYGRGLTDASRRPGPVPVFGSNGIVGRHDQAFTGAPCIIVGRKGSVGAVHLSGVECWPIDTTYYVDVFQGLEAKYVYHQLRHLGLAQLDTSTAVPGLSRSDACSQPFNVPPLAEQRRIVVQVEALLARTSTTRRRLSKVPSILRSFRRAVLAAACDGRLTADWRSKHVPTESASCFLARVQQERGKATGNRGRLRQPDFLAVEESGLPVGWCATRIGDVAECLDSARVPVNRGDRASRNGSVPYYGANGQVGWIDEYLFDEDLVLVVEDETFTGREKPFSYVVRGKCWVNNHAHVLRPLGGMPAEYLNACLAYYDFVPLTSGTTGRRKLTQASLVSAELAIAPLDEQWEIARRVETLFTLSEAVERRAVNATLRADKLSQSILARAFRGELVPTEAELARQEGRDYEPASVLLERIRTARNSSPNGRAPTRRVRRPTSPAGRQIRLTFA